MSYLCLAFAAMCLSTDPVMPIEFGLDQIREEGALPKYNDKLVKLTGQISFDSNRHDVLFREEMGNFSLTIKDPKTKKVEFSTRLQINDEKRVERIRKDILRNQSQRRETTITIVGKSVFARKVERPSDDYVVPDDLKPDSSAGVARMESSTQKWERLMRAGAAQAEYQRKILEDARKKGKIKVDVVYGSFSIRDVSDDLGLYKPKSEPARVDPESTASNKLQFAKDLLADSKKVEIGRQRLRDLIAEYPNSKAAEEAKKLLEDAK